MKQGVKEKEAFDTLSSLINDQQDRRLKFTGTTEEFYGQKTEREASAKIKAMTEEFATAYGFTYI